MYPTRDAAMMKARGDTCWGVIGGTVTFTDDGAAVIAHYPAIAPGLLSGGDWHPGREKMDIRYPYASLPAV